MMIFLRKEAVRLAAFIQIFRLSLSQRNFYIESALLEENAENVPEAKEYLYLRKYIEYEFNFVRNSYLERIISDNFNEKIIVKGRQPRLDKCSCCGYKTLKQKGHYEICKVCFWEDDITEDNEGFSMPNKMTLKEGKQNYQNYGASDKRSGEIIDKERMLKYEK